MKTNLFAIGIVLALCGFARAGEDFTGTKEIRLVRGDLDSPKAKTLVITDKTKIGQLVGAITLEEKNPSACDHIEHAIFIKAKGRVTVSLCEHCFDVGTHTYRMSPAFYKFYTACWIELTARGQAASDKAAKKLERGRAAPREPGK